MWLPSVSAAPCPPVSPPGPFSTTTTSNLIRRRAGSRPYPPPEGAGGAGGTQCQSVPISTSRYPSLLVSFVRTRSVCSISLYGVLYPVIFRAHSVTPIPNIPFTNQKGKESPAAPMLYLYCTLWCIYIGWGVGRVSSSSGFPYHVSQCQDNTCCEAKCREAGGCTGFAVGGEGGCVLYGHGNIVADAGAVGRQCYVDSCRFKYTVRTLISGEK